MGALEFGTRSNEVCVSAFDLKSVLDARLRLTFVLLAPISAFYVKVSGFIIERVVLGLQRQIDL